MSFQRMSKAGRSLFLPCSIETEVGKSCHRRRHQSFQPQSFHLTQECGTLTRRERGQAALDGLVGLRGKRLQSRLAHRRVGIGQRGSLQGAHDGWAARIHFAEGSDCLLALRPGRDSNCIRKSSGAVSNRGFSV